MTFRPLQEGPVQRNHGRADPQSYVEDTSEEGAQRQRVPLLSHQQPVLPRKEGDIEKPEMWPFYLYGRLIAILEQGARAHGEVSWLEQYYPRGFFPAAGLREPLERHRLSVLNDLLRQARAERYLARLDWLANALSNSEDEITFDT